MMDLSAMDTKKRSEQLLQRIDELRNQLRNIDPNTLASHTGIHYDSQSANGIFKFQFMKQSLCMNFPSLELSLQGQEKPPNPVIQALVIYYFFTADGMPLNHRWIAFSELPNGLFYNQAFQGYTGHMIAQKFQNDLPRFSIIAKELGGKIESFGDAAFRFQLLPRLPLLIAGWGGDDEFPSSFKVLFDASISHYLPTDACAIAGSMLTGMFLKYQS